MRGVWVLSDIQLCVDTVVMAEVPCLCSCLQKSVSRSAECDVTSFVTCAEHQALLDLNSSAVVCPLIS